MMRKWSWGPAARATSAPLRLTLGLVFENCSAMAKSDFSCVETRFFPRKSPLRIGSPNASTEVVHRPKSPSPLHFDIWNIWQIRSGKSFPSARRLLSAALLGRWPQVCRVKITFTKLPTNRFVSRTQNSMKCVVNWILLRICVRSRNTQPHHFMMRAVPSRIPNRKQKHSSLSGILSRISFIPNHFNRNRNRNRYIPDTIESVTICDICDQNMTTPVLLKKKNMETNSVTISNLGHFLNVTNKNSTLKCHKLVTHLV